MSPASPLAPAHLRRVAAWFNPEPELNNGFCPPQPVATSRTRENDASPLPHLMAWQLFSLESASVLLVIGGALFLILNAFGVFKVCLFSPVKGKVVLKGQPVVGAVIERSYDWAWGNKQGSDETVTDQNGEFTLPAIYGTMFLGQIGPHEPYIFQTILIKHDGKTYQAWCTDKRDYGEFSELSMAKIYGESPGLNGKPIDLYCPLENELRPRGGYGGIAELLSNHATISQS